MNVGFVHLGCSKNLVDTEMTIGLFKENGYKIVNNEEDADVLVINTCGFIGPAKEEAINTILEMAEYKKKRCIFNSNGMLGRKISRRAFKSNSRSRFMDKI